jgi:hypothetical protein
MSMIISISHLYVYETAKNQAFGFSYHRRGVLKSTSIGVVWNLYIERALQRFNIPWREKSIKEFQISL